MRNLILVMLGGAIGAGFRYGVGTLALRQLGASLPWGTLIANLSGGLLAGLLAACLIGEGDPTEPLRLFLGLGVLGGYTTFSAFSLEAVQMIQRGEAALAGAYIASSVVGSLLMTFLGFWAGRAVS
ncbi:MAG: CrcB family protein [Pseudomonadota bacterium]|nr:CrcB family protein [Pseudomonadota bacterium]